MRERLRYFILIVALLTAVPCVTVAARVTDGEVMRRVFAYADSIRAAFGAELADTVRSNVYTRYHFVIDRRNVTLLTMPDMYHMMRGRKRSFVGETYSSVAIAPNGKTEEFCHLHVSNLPRRRRPFVHVLSYMRPTLYGVTLVDNQLLSPFHRSNSHFYKYKVESPHNGISLVHFSPKVRNTQMVEGLAAVDATTGAIVDCLVKGTYQMTHFILDLHMGQEGLASLRAERCDVEARISYLGNQLSVWLTFFDGQPTSLPRSVSNSDSLQLIASLRPVPLPLEWGDTLFADVLTSNIPPQSITDSTTVSDTISGGNSVVRRAADAVWDVVQDNLLSRIRSDFGDASRHQLRIGPIFNPLYFGYGRSSGVVYKFNMDFNYYISSNQRLRLDFKGGYSFRQHQLYYEVPIAYTFNARRNGFVSLTLRNGNRISDASVLQQVKQLHKSDTVDFDRMNLGYFKDMSLQLMSGYTFMPQLDARVGCVFHRRSAVNPSAFEQVHHQSTYHSFAPLVELSCKPAGLRGPVITAAWEHGLKGIFNSDISYDRWELDGAYILPLQCTRSLAMRTGLGFYTSRGSTSYFLDYNNFRKNHIPGGWRDKYTGEFELLNSNWYNASDYYLRLNATYESPLFLLSRLPWLGHIVERERIHASALAVRHLIPYVECGYGMTNHIFSISTFVAFSPKGYENFAVRMSLELFDGW